MSAFSRRTIPSWPRVLQRWRSPRTGRSDRRHAGHPVRGPSWRWTSSRIVSSARPPQGHECRLRLHDHLRCERDRARRRRGHQTGSIPRAATRAATTSVWWARPSRASASRSTSPPRLEGRTSRGAGAPGHQPQRARTDYVDVWYLHGKQTAAQLTDDLLEAQQIAKKAGKIRFAGVSMHSGHSEVIPAAIQFGQDRRRAHLLQLHDGETLDELIGKAKAAGSAWCYEGDGRRIPPLPGQRDSQARRRDDRGACGGSENPDIGTTIPSMTDMDQFEANFKCMPESSLRGLTRR